jgi:hypothetical protein
VISYVYWVLAKHHDWGCLFLLVLQKKLRTWFYRMVCLKFWVDNYILTYTHCQELTKSLGSHGSLSPVFVMKMTWSMFFFCGGFLYVLWSFCICLFWFLLVLLLVVSQYHGWVFVFLLDLQQKLSMHISIHTGLYPL